MRLQILAVGKLKERYFVEACDEYAGRLRRYLPTELVELRAAEEAARRLAPRAELWALDERGEELDSAQLAAELERRMGRGLPALAFLIGGAEGLPEAVRRGAARSLSLSRLTLPHRLARLILLEQLYRALTIIRGEPYHKP